MINHILTNIIYFFFKGVTFIDILAQTLDIQPNKTLTENVFSSLLQSAVETEDEDILKKLLGEL